MELPIYQVDAFTSRLFGGNPAAIVPFESQWLDDGTLQSIAAENNLAETAYIIRKSAGRYDLRWFTPTVEMDLCGHATLASAFVIFKHLEPGLSRVAFERGPANSWSSARRAGCSRWTFPPASPSPALSIRG